MKKFLLSSHNKGKIAEFTQLFSPLEWQLVSTADYDLEDVEETGSTFLENAIIKARHGAALTGLPTLADDSGLMVPALGGAPGVISARYAGDKANTESNNQKLLKAMEAIPKEERQGCYCCILVFMRHAEDPLPIIAQGQWWGSIAQEPKGSGGFGYDPLFIVDANTQKTAAELPSSEKHIRSHRGKAITQLMAQLSQFNATTISTSLK